MQTGNGALADGRSLVFAQKLQEQFYLLGHVDQDGQGQLVERFQRDENEILGRILLQQVGAQRPDHCRRGRVVVHVLQDGDQLEFHHDVRRDAPDHVGDFATHAHRERFGLGGELGGRADRRFHFHGVVRVQAGADAVVHLAALGYDARDAAERTQGQPPGHRVVGMDDAVDPADELVDVQDLVDVLLRLLAHAQHPEAQEVAAQPEHVGQLQERRVDQDRERVLLDEPREPDDGLALFTDAAGPQALVQLDQRRVGVLVGLAQQRLADGTPRGRHIADWIDGRLAARTVVVHF